MSPENQSYDFTQLIQASPKQVFYAFTNATALKEWLSDFATTTPRLGGRIYLAWNSGYYASGEFTAFDPDTHLAFTWFGRNEPAPTLVDVTLVLQDSGTLIRMVHSGLGSGEIWEDTIKEVKNGWATSLENLASALESGPDLRVVLRPMLGITVGDFDAQQAEHLGVPVNEGIRLDSTLEGMGAYAAGLQKDDVIVEMDGRPINDWASLVTAMDGRRAGDIVEVTFYRRDEKMTTRMELSRRPIPDIPTTVSALAQVVKERYDGLQAQLDELLSSVSESEASFKISPDEWNVKEVLAHLIHSERDGQTDLAEMVGGQVRWADDYAGNLDMRNSATLAAFPTLIELRQELKRMYLESAALYASIPPEFPQQRKGTWWGMAYYVCEEPYHGYGHFEQIESSLQAARQ